MGPFPSRPILGSIRGEGTPPTNPSCHLRKERSKLPLEWLLKENRGRRPIAVAATAHSLATATLAAAPTASPCPDYAYAAAYITIAAITCSCAAAAITAAATTDANVVPFHTTVVPPHTTAAPLRVPSLCTPPAQPPPASNATSAHALAQTLSVVLRGFCERPCAATACAPARPPPAPLRGLHLPPLHSLGPRPYVDSARAPTQPPPLPLLCHHLRLVTKRFMRSLKHTNLSQTKFIIPNSQ